VQTELIAHRINTLAELAHLPMGVGVELDLRDEDQNLILQHDPFHTGESFENFLRHYKGRGTLILNVKSERIEERVLSLVNQYEIKDYFFLDSTFPMIFKLSGAGEKNIALRLSEFEGLETIRNFKHRVNWVWVDCFTKFILTKEMEAEIHDLGYKICIVSPELQGRKEEIEAYILAIQKQKIKIDAVCSKIENHAAWSALNTAG
jgi:hypothetical protein